MKKIIILFIFLIITVFNFYSSATIDKIGVVNLDEVIAKVFSGQSGVIQQIKEEKIKLQNKLDQIKENINKLEEKKLSTNDTNRRISIDKNIEKLKKDYSDYYKLRSYQIKKMQDNALGSVLKEIRDVIKKISEKEGYTMVLDADIEGILFYTIDIDITEKVIDYFNNQYGDEETE